jgi:hypothetical protein
MYDFVIGVPNRVKLQAALPGADVGLQQARTPVSR